jgi:PAS domain-containing protein
MEDQRDQDMEFRIVRPDGAVRWVHRQGQVERDLDGKPIRVSGITCDITERKRAQEALELVTRLPGENPAPVMRLKEGSVLSFVNPAGERLLKVWGKALGDEVPAEIASLARAVLTGGEKRQCEITFDDRTFVVAVVPVLHGDYVNLYFSDISERKQAEEEVRRLLEQAKAREQERRDEKRAVQTRIGAAGHEHRCAGRERGGEDQCMRGSHDSSVRHRSCGLTAADRA